MAVLWETVDRLGRTVRMTDSAWEHILHRHQEFHPELSQIEDAIAHADEVRRDRDFVRRAVHYRDIGRGRARLRVVVNYLPDEHLGWIGDIITAYVSDRVYKKEDSLWP